LLDLQDLPLASALAGPSRYSSKVFALKDRKTSQPAARLRIFAP
jgi:hypothetical protein